MKKIESMFMNRYYLKPTSTPKTIFNRGIFASIDNISRDINGIMVIMLSIDNMELWLQHFESEMPYLIKHPHNKVWEEFEFINKYLEIC